MRIPLVLIVCFWFLPCAHSQNLTQTSRSVGKPLVAPYSSFYHPGGSASGPRVYAPVKPRTVTPKYPWKKNVVATIFWVGEEATVNNRVPNDKSSWDTRWAINFGGTDDPVAENRTWDFCPKDFKPGLNPFYIALPYNDVLNSWTTKSEAFRVIPWFKSAYVKKGRSVCNNRWVSIRFGHKVCYAQWSDCGPFVTDDWEYVFGDKRPKNTKNDSAGIDVGPAVRDYLGLRSGQAVDWRFVDHDEVPPGPWCTYGTNNPFVNARANALTAAQKQKKAEYEELKARRERWLKSQSANYR